MKFNHSSSGSTIRFHGWGSCLAIMLSGVLCGVDTGRVAAQVSESALSTSELALPVIEGKWLRPAMNGSAQPVWGHAQGMRVGLHPLRGPRGLLRIYAPYLGQPKNRVINYIAVEPIPQGDIRRGLSELEHSELDDTQGKRFWSADSADEREPRPSNRPARGWVEKTAAGECLRVFIFVERFDNGAHVYLRLTFQADRPYEVGIATFAHVDSAPLKNCIASATMGNFARLRELQLADRVVSPHDLWPEYRGDGFTPHARFELSDLARTPDGDVVAIARPNETRPEQANYAPGTRQGWHYEGAVASQSWRSATPDPHLAVQVNGRRVYWNSDSPIPGGVSYENFEMVAPFQQGGEFWFGAESLPSPPGTQWNP